MLTTLHFTSHEDFAGANNSEKKPELDHKIVFLGNAKTGKTSIISRFLHNTFSEEYAFTIGAAYTKKEYLYLNHVIRLSMWDTAGEERYMSLIPMYLPNSDEVVIVFDVTNRKSFEDIENWISFVNSAIRDPMIFVVGNKIEEDRVINFDEAHQKCSELGCFYFEVSAKFNVHVQELFLVMAKKTKTSIKSGKFGKRDDAINQM
ncbi:unnamed protein product [Blepharisma stoltei]|uniref:Uncharacterized protein n=1 Tax=Blepharisma stoltei TaxID=1481888 RepID=A0AAU9KB45_9CILI|nr:unnamed protein product [Blepharisma stoltei]